MQFNVSGVVLDGTTPATAAPARTDLVVYQNADVVVKVTVTGANGAAFDLTTWNGTLTVKDRILPATGAPRTKLTYAGVNSTPATSGVVTFTIPDTDLNTLSLQSYWWDVFLVNNNNLALREPVVLPGLLTVNPTVGSA